MGQGGFSRGQCLGKMREGPHFGKSWPGLKVQLGLRDGEEPKPEITQTVLNAQLQAIPCMAWEQESLPSSGSNYPPAPPPGWSTGLLANWQAGPHLLGNLGCVQLVPELSGQITEALGTSCSLPTADSIPVALKVYLMTLRHGKNPAQLPRAWSTCELFQKGRSQQQLLRARHRGLGKFAYQEMSTALPKAAQCWHDTGEHLSHCPASDFPCTPQIPRTYV